MKTSVAGALSPKDANKADSRAAGSRSFAPIDNRLAISPQIYERLRRAITTLAMLPSESLSEKELSQALGVSRTPVREALIRLAAEGLIDILPQRGSFVAPIRLADVEEAQFIREALEVSVISRLTGRCSREFIASQRANLAAQQRAIGQSDHEQFLELDESFHRAFCEEAGLAKSWRVIQSVKLQMDRVRYLSLPEAGQLDTLLEQHKTILEALEDGDRKTVKRRMSVHLQEVLNTVRRLVEVRPDMFSS
ncbi:GntR family transcriptional regulator [Fulvimarina sp. MAC8]|uniref:GntR family transcriptional regulator n=1 Tax=Fulvimarina sp. MAC8 TaxID=3162874 RepID=UPI0032EB8921